MVYCTRVVPEIRSFSLPKAPEIFHMHPLNSLPRFFARFVAIPRFGWQQSGHSWKSNREKLYGVMTGLFGRGFIYARSFIEAVQGDRV